MEEQTETSDILDQVNNLSKASVSDGTLDLLSGLTDKPPDDILAFEEDFSTDVVMDVEEPARPEDHADKMEVDCPSEQENPEVAEQSLEGGDLNDPWKEQQEDTESTLTASERQDSENISEMASELKQPLEDSKVSKQPEESGPESIPTEALTPVDEQVKEEENREETCSNKSTEGQDEVKTEVEQMEAGESEQSFENQDPRDEDEVSLEKDEKLEEENGPDQDEENIELVNIPDAPQDVSKEELVDELKENQSDESEEIIEPEPPALEETPKHRGRTPKQDKNIPSPVVETQPSVRRSSRANKGIGKEIFDPSYIPKSKMPSLEPPKRHTSPSSDHSSTFSSPGSSRGRPRKSLQSSPTKPKQADDELQNTDLAPKTKKKTPDSAKPKSRNDFSDDDDNVPLKQLKTEEDGDYEEDSDPASEEISSSDDDSDDSYNNPDRLWCICQKPHNNRFMISCDKCEEWFHGDCVGITLQRGKKMEEKGEEYICPKCLKKSQLNETHKKQKISEKKKEDKKEPPSDSRKRTISSEEANKRSLKSFALKGQIQKSRGVNFPQRKKLKVFDEKAGKKSASMTVAKVKKTTEGTDGKAQRKCIVSSCENTALSGSVYCSNQCILRHAKESLKSIAKDKEQGIVKQKLMKRESNPNTHNRDQKDRVAVHCRRTNKILTGNSAPYRRDLAAFLKAHPSYEVYRPRPRPSPNQDKTPSKQPQGTDVTGKAVTSLDFYRHVEVQNRKRDRYGTDPDYSPPVKKISDGGFNLLDKKQKTASNVVKIANQGPVTSAPKLLKRRESIETAKKPEASRERIPEKKKPEIKEQRRKSAGEVTSSSRKTSENWDRPPKKVERGGSLNKSEVNSTSDIRHNVKKTLLEILTKRSQSSDDLKMHRDSIARLATKVEESLFKIFGDTNMKYKNKYRSIMFNLKDTRNQGLWRKVIIGDVSTSELVQMTAEQMASKKLAEWRKMELSHELDIIEKQEKEEGNVRPVAKITHKGEIAIQEDLSDLTVTTVNQRDNAHNPMVAPARKKRSSLSEEDPFEPNSISSPDDTTLKHREHLFDLNCKICTGKVKEEDIEFPEEDSVKKIKSSSSIILSSEAQKATKSLPKSPPKSHLMKPEASKKKIKKSKSNRIVSDSRSHDPSLSPSSFLQKRSKSPTPEKKKIKKKPVLPNPPPLSDLAPHTNLDVAKETKNKSPVDPNTPLVSQEEPKVDDPPAVEEEQSPLPPTPQASTVKRSQLIWSGNISMLELSTFKANVYPVTGNCENLDIDLPPRLVLGGRIHPKVVWDYLLKVKALPTKQLSIIRFHAASDDDRVGYVAMLSYFSSRKRFGVVSNQDRLLLKDMYLIPLLESQKIPEELVKTLSGEDLDEALPTNRPSMLLGVIVRQAPKQLQLPTEIVEVKKQQHKVVEENLPADKKEEDAGADQHQQEEEEEEEEEEEYVPDEDPLIPGKVPVPLTDEELGSKSSSKSGSLFERNKSLAPSLRFFMRKASEEEQSIREQHSGDKLFQPTAGDIKEDKEDDGGDYDPTDAVGEDEGNEDEPYDPEQEEEYDPETAFPDREEDAPYDPEEDDEMLKNQEAKEMDELVEKQAYLEKMQKELEEKKAKLAEVEQNLQKSNSPQISSAKDSQRVDPRMAARRAAKDKEEKTPPSVVEPPKNPLQTILSALNMSGGTQSSSMASGFLSILQKKEQPSSPPPLPDSTTKSDVEEVSEDQELKQEKNSEKSGLVSYASTPDSTHDDVIDRKREEDERGNKKGRRRDERRHRSTSSSSTSSRESSGYRRRRHDNGGHHDDRRHRKSGRRSRSRSPNSRSRRHRQDSPRHFRRHDDRRSWSRDRRR